MADSLADRIAELETSCTAELGARWEQAFKRSAPNRASRDLLLRTLAYHVRSAMKRLRRSAERLRRPGRKEVLRITILVLARLFGTDNRLGYGNK